MDQSNDFMFIREPGAPPATTYAPVTSRQNMLIYVTVDEKQCSLCKFNFKIYMLNGLYLIFLVVLKCSIPSSMKPIYKNILRNFDHNLYLYWWHHFVSNHRLVIHCLDEFQRQSFNAYFFVRKVKIHICYYTFISVI